MAGPSVDSMMKLEQLLPGAVVRGIIPDTLVVVVNVQWFGSAALELTYKPPDGKPENAARACARETLSGTC